MNPRGSSQGRPRDPATDKAILEATRTHLGKDGYVRMTIDSVATSAGVTRPTVYRRWPSKEHLVIAALEDVAAPGEVQDSGDCRADLLAILRTLRANLVDRKHFAILGGLLQDTEESELVRLFRQRLLAPRRASLLQVITLGRQRGQVRPDVDAELIVAMFIGAFYSTLLAGLPVAPDWEDRILAVGWCMLAAGPDVVDGSS